MVLYLMILRAKLSSEQLQQGARMFSLALAKLKIAIEADQSRSSCSQILEIPAGLGLLRRKERHSARDRAKGPRRAEEERDDYSSFSAGGREGDEVPRE